MAPVNLFAALGALTLAVPLAAASPYTERPDKAPKGDAKTRYCMNIEAVTGTRIERLKCWTRAEWKSQGVDVDAAWGEEGVRVIG